jgi:hypothetical protein
MSNSSLVNYTKLSPNCSSPRTNTIKKITIHHMAGNLTVEDCGELFAKTSRGASSNYGIGTDGRVGMYVEERNRAWTSGNRDNDQQAVTIEVANNGGAPNWEVSDAAYSKLIDLCVDICKRNNITKLNYTGTKDGNLTMHSMFAATACPGPYLKSKFSDIANKVNAKLVKTKTPTPAPSPVVPQTVTVPTKITQSNVSIQNFLNKYYGSYIKTVLGSLLAVDGSLGPASKKAIAIAFQVELNKVGAKLSIDGSFGPACATAFASKVTTLKHGTTGIFVTLWQCLLVAYGYNPNGIDGSFGNGCVTATNALFGAKGISKDSSVSGSDIDKLL